MRFEIAKKKSKRIIRSAVIVEINTKDVKFYHFYIFGINFHNDCASGYSLYNQVVHPKQLRFIKEQEASVSNK